jgi:hypothetical protein
VTHSQELTNHSVTKKKRIVLCFCPFTCCLAWALLVAGKSYQQRFPQAETSKVAEKSAMRLERQLAWNKLPRRDQGCFEKAKEISCRSQKTQRSKQQTFFFILFSQI